MADNYIEKQQELYEARKAAWKQAQKYGKKKSTTVKDKSNMCSEDDFVAHIAIFKTIY